MKRVLLCACLSFVVGSVMYGQDLHTRALRLNNAGVLSTLVGSPTGGTFTLPSTGGTLLSSANGVQYAPSATQASLTTNSTFLFDVAYDPSVSGSVAGARISAVAGGQSAGDATGLSIVATAANAGSSNATGLLVTSTATTGTNTIAKLAGKNGEVVIDGRNGSVAGTTGTLKISGARETLTGTFAKVDFLNFDQSGSGTDLVLARLEAKRSDVDAASLHFYTGTSTLNTTPALSLTAAGHVAVNGTNAATTLNVHGDVAIAEQNVANVISLVTTSVDASGQSNIMVQTDAGGGVLRDIQGGSEGKILCLYNSQNNLTIKNDAGTTPTDGILTMTGGDITTVGEGMVVFLYSMAAGGRWLVTSFNP